MLSKLPILLKGIKFKIKNKETNEYLCQITNQKICEFETDDKGIMLTPLELSGGTYIIEEIEFNPHLNPPTPANNSHTVFSIY